MFIDIQGITKRFESYTALDAIDLRIGDGELVALLGPSGSGKTTLLRIIAGLETADSGRILLGGEDALSRPPRDRNVGFVFQHYALFRHMTVAANVAFGLEVRPRGRRPSKAVIAERVAELLDLVQLGHLADRYPNQLSGGQRQRVALARALAIEPKVLLLDEPFGALDAKVRKELRRWLRRLHDEMRMTSVFVTHDQEEALELADRVVVMDHGRIEQVGSPAEVYADPASSFVVDFLGDASRIEAIAARGCIELEALPAAIGAAKGVTGPVSVYVRPHDVEVGAEVGDGFLPARVVAVSSLGAKARVDLDFAGFPLEAEVETAQFDALRLRRGDSAGVRIAGGFVFARGRKTGAPVRMEAFRPVVPASARGAQVGRTF
jgi:sulfate/thiosulfate transport system ATP-binding protein